MIREEKENTRMKTGGGFLRWFGNQKLGKKIMYTFKRNQAEIDLGKSSVQVSMETRSQCKGRLRKNSGY